METSKLFWCDFQTTWLIGWRHNIHAVSLEISSFQEFSLMKSDAVVINIARGPVVDEVPFWAALQGEKIGTEKIQFSRLLNVFVGQHKVFQKVNEQKV